MRYAASIIKAICLFLLSALFILFLIYAINFGEDGDQFDFVMSNLLVSAMILVLIISGLSALVFDFYERNKWQNEKLFNELSEKIIKLNELEPKINASMTENIAKTETIFNNLTQKMEENSAQTQEFMTQFANLSVQVFAKDKQEYGMQHSESFVSPEQANRHNDYFSHYTSEPLPVLDKNSTPDNFSEPKNVIGTAEQNDDIVILQSDNKTLENSAGIDSSHSSINLIEPENTKSVDDLLQDKNNNTEQPDKNSEDKLSEIFNSELADTLADLEIMQDDENTAKTTDIDLSSYFENAEKVKL